MLRMEAVFIGPPIFKICFLFLFKYLFRPQVFKNVCYGATKNIDIVVHLKLRLLDVF